MTKDLKKVSNVKNHKNQENEEVESIEQPIEIVDEELQTLLASYKPDEFILGSGTYKLVKNYRDGFDYEATIKRYNDVLEKYDFIVGDWGYDQLRLKGFFIDEFKSAPIDAKISTLEDYLYEYCNFGCAYFVIQQIGDFKRRGRLTSSNKKKSTKPIKEDKKQNQTNKKKSNNRNKKNKNQSNKKESTTTKKTNQTKTKHQFTIRKKEKE